jgi:hypothetical protein
MKSFKFLILAIALVSFSFTMSSCGSKSADKDAMETVDKSGAEYTSAYVCPMHCEGSGSAEPGKCPVCGMDYVANADAKADDSDDHSGHNH